MAAFNGARSTAKAKSDRHARPGLGTKSLEPALLAFVLETMMEGLVVFGPDMEVASANRSGERFLKKHRIPDEVEVISRRLFDALRQNRVSELFPGEVHLRLALPGSPSKWNFQFHLYGPAPCVCVFIREMAPSQQLDLNSIRQEHRITRRELDVIRRVLDGSTNDEIAREFRLTEQTVKDHLSTIYQKLGVRNRLELLRFFFDLQVAGRGNVPGPAILPR